MARAGTSAGSSGRTESSNLAPALDRADRDRIGHEKRLETGLDGEQSGDTL